MTGSAHLFLSGLLIEDTKGRILLGKRTNRPAQGYWFVPGSRIRKNEKLAVAVKKISSTELGTEILIENATLLGAFDHIYSDNFHNAEDINSHYVALAYKISVTDDLKMEFDDQHSEMCWWPKENLLNDTSVHNNTKAYF